MHDFQARRLLQSSYSVAVNIRPSRHSDAVRLRRRSVHATVPASSRRSPATTASNINVPVRASAKRTVQLNGQFKRSSRFCEWPTTRSWQCCHTAPSARRQYSMGIRQRTCLWADNRVQRCRQLQTSSNHGRQTPTPFGYTINRSRRARPPTRPTTAVTLRKTEGYGQLVIGSGLRTPTQRLPSPKYCRSVRISYALPVIFQFLKYSYSFCSVPV
jgi:hypothetical protein